MLRIKFKRLHPDAVIPKYAKEGDAGLDLVCVGTSTHTNTRVTYSTGLSIEIPEGYVGLIFPRSSICKYEISLSNAVGVLDSGYRGEIKFVFNKLNGFFSQRYNMGDRIGQLVILPYPRILAIEVDQLSETSRGFGGFGSSGA